LAQERRAQLSALGCFMLRASAVLPLSEVSRHVASASRRAQDRVSHAIRIKSPLLQLGVTQVRTAVAPRLPRHRSLRRARPAPSSNAKDVVAKGVKRDVDDEVSDDGYVAGVPPWAFAEKPIWLGVLRTFLARPDLLVINMGDGETTKHRRIALRSLACEELVLRGRSDLRAWSKGALSGTGSLRPIALVATSSDDAGDATELLKSLGYGEVANLRTWEFLARVLEMSE